MIGVLCDILLYPTRLVGIADWMTIIALLITVAYFWLTSNYSHWDGRGIPVWKPFPMVGSFLPTMLKGVHGADEELAASCDNGVLGTFLGRQPMLQVFDANVVKDICIKNFSHFVNHNSMARIEGKYVSYFLTMLKDDQWKGMRNVVTPTFSGSKMKMLVPSIETCAERLVQTISPYTSNGKPVDMKLITGYFALDTVASALFGVAIDSHAEAETAKMQRANNASFKDNSFSAHANAVFNSSSLTLMMFMIFLPTPIRNVFLRMGVGSTIFGEGEHWEFFSNFVEQVIDIRKSNKDKDVNRVDCLSLLLDAHKLEETRDEIAVSALDTTNETADQVRNWKIGKRALNHDEIVANAMLFYMAGFETTATTIAWTMYNLAAQSECQQTLYDEIVDTCEDGKPLTYDRVCGMTYLDAVINETLRMYPPATRTDRMCNQSCQLGDVHLESGDWVMFSIWAIHHNHQYWPEPYTFRPERFLPVEKESIVPCSFLPFGLGPRNCVGQRLAYLEMKTAVVHLVRNFVFTVDRTQTSIPPQLSKSGRMTAAVNGIHLFASNR